MVGATMMEFVLMGMLTAVAWVHARLTVVSVIHRTHTPDQMLHKMCVDTGWWVVVVIMSYYSLGLLGTWITLYALARGVFLLFTNWPAVCDNYAEIKRLLSGN